MATSGFLSGGTLVTPAITYPTSPKPSQQEWMIDFGGTQNHMDSGVLESVRGFVQPQMVVVLHYEDLSVTDADILRNFYVNSARGPSVTFRLLDPVDGVTVLGNFRFIDDTLERALFDYNGENISVSMIQVFEYSAPWSTFADESTLPTNLVFPASVVPQYELVERAHYRTIMPAEKVGGVETRLRSPGWPIGGLRSYSMRWKVLSEADMTTLWEFFRDDAQGWLVPFTLHDPRDGTTSLGQYRFADPILRRQHFAYILYSMGLSVVEV